MKFFNTILIYLKSRNQALVKIGQLYQAVYQNHLPVIYGGLPQIPTQENTVLVQLGDQVVQLVEQVLTSSTSFTNSHSHLTDSSCTRLHQMKHLSPN